MKKKLPTHGGRRLGSGRPKGEPTTTVSVRVKTKWAVKIKQVIAAEIKRLEGDG
jgi:hypothetical protein